MLTRDDFPLDWAKAQGRLGGALLALGKLQGDAERLEEAVATCRVALEVLTRENAPADWAKAQGHLGDGRVALRWSEETGQTKWNYDVERFKHAAEAYRKALKVLTPENAPLDSARAQVKLGEAHLQLGRRTQDDSHYGEADYAFRLAIKVSAYKEHAPADWARTQRLLGETLLSWGGNEARLKGAVAACREALKVLTRKNAPADWAKTQGHIGGALVALGKLQGDAERLEEAVVTCRAALTRESSDQHWAATHVHLGDALLALCERQGDDKGRLKDAVAAFGAALAGGHRKGKYWNGVRERGKHARARLARLG